MKLLDSSNQYFTNNISNDHQNIFNSLTINQKNHLDTSFEESIMGIPLRVGLFAAIFLLISKRIFAAIPNAVSVQIQLT